MPSGPSLAEALEQARTSPTISIETGGLLWGLGRTKARELARTGEFPSPVVKIGCRYRVLSAPLLRLLDGAQ